MLPLPLIEPRLMESPPKKSSISGVVLPREDEEKNAKKGKKENEGRVEDTHENDETKTSRNEQLLTGTGGRTGLPLPLSGGDGKRTDGGEQKINDVGLGMEGGSRECVKGQELSLHKASACMQTEYACVCVHACA